MARRSEAPRAGDILPAELQRALLAALEAEAALFAFRDAESARRSQYIVDHAWKALEGWRRGKLTSDDAVEAIQKALAFGRERGSGS